ncbi:MAG TPA: hypothetical protein GX696_02310 [Pseudomonadaceae bacterium]|nr:hypothetical protein [Pseudomonadaceae bacterium]
MNKLERIVADLGSFRKGLPLTTTAIQPGCKELNPQAAEALTNAIESKKPQHTGAGSSFFRLDARGLALYIAFPHS